jgi:hypothetical protein
MHEASDRRGAHDLKLDSNTAANLSAILGQTGNPHSLQVQTEGSYLKMRAVAARNFVREGLSVLSGNANNRRRGCGLFKVPPAGLKGVRQLALITSCFPIVVQKHSVCVQESTAACRLKRAYPGESGCLWHIKASGQSIGGRQNFSSPISCSTCLEISETLPISKEGSKDKRWTRCVKARSQDSDTSHDPSEATSVPSGSPSEVQSDTQPEVAGETSQGPAETLADCWDILLVNSLEVITLVALSGYLISKFVSGFQFSAFEWCFLPFVASTGASASSFLFDKRFWPLRYQHRDPRLPPEWHNLLDAT